MNAKKWTSAVVRAATTPSYPALWTAVPFAGVPVLLRSVSSLVEGSFLLTVGQISLPSTPFIASAAFVPCAVGCLKYAASSHLLAYALWVTTFLSVAVLGIVMFEAFSPPWEWSGSLTLPGLVVGSCGVGVMGGAVVLQAPWYRRRTGRCTPR